MKERENKERKKATCFSVLSLDRSILFINIPHEPHLSAVESIHPRKKELKK